VHQFTQEQIALIPDRVTRGLKWAIKKALLDKVDEDKLNMRGACGCFLGQAEGHYLDGMRRFRLDRKEMLALGFICDPTLCSVLDESKHYYDALTAE
jgi:hypothetical protein